MALQPRDRGFARLGQLLLFLFLLQLLFQRLSRLLHGGRLAGLGFVADAVRTRLLARQRRCGTLSVFDGRFLLGVGDFDLQLGTVLLCPDAFGGQDARRAELRSRAELAPAGVRPADRPHSLRTDKALCPGAFERGQVLEVPAVLCEPGCRPVDSFRTVVPDASRCLAR